MKALLLALMLSTDPITVSVYSPPCKLERVYYAEYVYISAGGIVTVTFSDGGSVDIPLKYVQELNVQFGAFLRSYSLVDGVVKVSETAQCPGAV